MNNQKRARLAPSHSTYIPVAKLFRDFAIKLSGVTCVSAGIIKNARPGAPIRVKITDESGAILLKIRGPASVQEVRVYSSNIQEVRTALAREVRNRNFHLSFTKDIEAIS